MRRANLVAKLKTTKVKYRLAKPEPTPEKITVTVNGKPLDIDLPTKYSTNIKDYIPYISIILTGLLYVGAQALHLDKVFDINTVYAFATALVFFVVSASTTWRHNPITKKAKQKQVIANQIYSHLQDKEKM